MQPKIFKTGHKTFIPSHESKEEITVYRKRKVAQNVALDLRHVPSEYATIFQRTNKSYIAVGYEYRKLVQFSR